MQIVIVFYYSLIAFNVTFLEDVLLAQKINSQGRVQLSDLACSGYELGLELGFWVVVGTIIVP